MERTSDSYPFQVGRVVYATLEEALAKANVAKTLYPNATVVVIDRRTNEVAHVAVVNTF